MKWLKAVASKYNIKATPETGHDLELLAASILSTMAAAELNRVKDLTSKDAIENFTFITNLGDPASIKEPKVKNPSVQDFIEHFPLKIVVTFFGGAAYPNGRYSKGRRTIEVFKKDYDSFKKHWDNYHGYAKVTKEDLLRFLEEVESTLIHELTHAFDDYRSKSKALKESSQDLIDKGGFEHYLRNTAEINARFAQAVKAIRKTKLIPLYQTKRGGFDNYFAEFKMQFNLSVLDPKQQERIKQRLYKEYMTLTPKERTEMLEGELVSKLWKFAYEGTFPTQQYDSRLGRFDWKAEMKRHLPKFDDALQQVKEEGRLEELEEILQKHPTYTHNS